MAYALSPFVTVFREMLELRYLWQRPVRLDSAKLVAFLGAEPHTPIDAAVRAKLVGLGCLPDSGRSTQSGAENPPANLGSSFERHAAWTGTR